MATSAPMDPNKRPADDEASAGATTSKRFKEGHGDIILVSSDGVRHFVHRANLCAASQIFADMLSIGTSDSESPLPEVILTESSSVLGALLPFVYPGPQTAAASLFQRFDQRLSLEIMFADKFCEFLKAVDKYEVWRAIEACEREIFGAVQKNYLLIPAFAFASHFNFTALAEDAGQRVAESLTFSTTMENCDRIGKTWTPILPAKLTPLLKFLGQRQAGIKIADEFTLEALVKLPTHTVCANRTTLAAVARPLQVEPSGVDSCGYVSVEP